MPCNPEPPRRLARPNLRERQLFRRSHLSWACADLAWDADERVSAEADTQVPREDDLNRPEYLPGEQVAEMRIQASAPGKVILLGEHAVVYGRPAIAVPLSGLRATVTVEPGRPGSGVVIEARDLGRTLHAGQELADPLVVTVNNTLARLGVPDPGDLHLTIASDIPIASGLGSGAAVAVATIRALDAWFTELPNAGVEALAGSRLEDRLRKQLTDAEVSALAYETEVLHHGTPSGIDNSVVTYERPIVFTRARGAAPFLLGRPLTLVVGDTGIASLTRETVGDVRRAWQADPARYEALFDAVAETVAAGRAAIERGDAPALGAALRRDHALLQELGVSCPELDALVAAAEEAGALGAKLAGGGRGGNMIALVTRETADRVAAALRAAGARRALVSEIA